jgi:hypothetical protein
MSKKNLYIFLIITVFVLMLSGCSFKMDVDNPWKKSGISSDWFLS